MLEKSIAWRKAERIDDILTEDFHKVEKCLKIYTKGHDREGRPGKWSMILHMKEFWN